MPVTLQQVIQGPLRITGLVSDLPQRAAAGERGPAEAGRRQEPDGVTRLGQQRFHKARQQPRFPGFVMTPKLGSSGIGEALTTAAPDRNYRGYMVQNDITRYRAYLVRRHPFTSYETDITLKQDIHNGTDNSRPGADLTPAAQMCSRVIQRLDDAAEQVRRSIP
jgi:hypothetical protein